MRSVRKLFIALTLILTSCQGYEENQLHLGEDNLGDFIVGGIEVPVSDSLHHQVLSLKIYFEPHNEPNTPPKRIVGQCTASAVSPQIILTAAHCVSPQAKEYRLLVPKPDGTTEHYFGRHVIVHPNYKVNRFADLALIALDRKLPKNIKILKIPKGDLIESLNVIRAAGFGRITGIQSFDGKTGLLRTTPLKVLHFNKEASTFRTDQTQGKGVCQGDSGGPGMIDINGDTFVVGVVSKTVIKKLSDGTEDFCAAQGIYVNVQFYAENWIIPTIQKLRRY